MQCDAQNTKMQVRVTATEWPSYVALILTANYTGDVSPVLIPPQQITIHPFFGSVGEESLEIWNYT
jgi:hypothetical protein